MNSGKPAPVPAATVGKVAVVAADFDAARRAHDELAGACATVDADEADIVVALGGDGFLLATLRRFFERDVRVFGMNRGSVGFLMNEYRADGLVERLAAAQTVEINPLRMTATDEGGTVHTSPAINEVSLLRQTYQAAKLEIRVDGVVRLAELICDGALVATPAGSTAYNLSAHGPIMPLAAHVLALTPISAFRPRRWRGALLPSNAVVEFRVIEPAHRPVSATADATEVRRVTHVSVREDRTRPLRLMFDPDQSLDERILKEQFAP